MESDQIMQLGDYEYQIVSYKNAHGMYQGVILLVAYAGIKYSPIVEVQTPTVFKAERAARIEAMALAYQLIETGAIVALVPQDGKTTSWPEEPLIFR